MNAQENQEKAEYYNSKGHFTTSPLSISVVELDEMETPEQLESYLDTLVQVTRITFLEGVAERYPHLVKAQPEVGL